MSIHIAHRALQTSSYRLIEGLPSGNRHARRVGRDALCSRRIDARHVVLVSCGAVAGAVDKTRLRVDRRVQQLVGRAARSGSIDPVPGDGVARAVRRTPCQVNLVRLSSPAQAHNRASTAESSAGNRQLT